MKKRGMSNVIVSVLLVLLVLAAVVIIWSVISLLLQDQGEVSSAKQRLLTEDLEISNFEGDAEVLQKFNITIARGPAKSILINVTEREYTLDADIISVTDLSGSMVESVVCLSPAGEDLSDCVEMADDLACDLLCWDDGFSTQCGLCFDSVATGGYCNAVCSVDDLVFFGSDCSRCIDSATANYIINDSTCIDHCGGGEGIRIYQTKLDEAKSVNLDLIEKILESEDEKPEGKRIGLVGFSHYVDESYCYDLTDNSDLLKGVVNSWTNYGGTSICAGINNAVEKFEDSESENKIIILMGDGEPADSCWDGTPLEDSIRAVQQAVSEGINVYTVGFTYNVISENILRQLAEEGESEYYKANIGELAETYTEIITEIEKNYAVEKTDYLRVVVYNGTDVRISTIPGSEAPSEPFEVRKYEIEISPGLFNVTKIEVFPVLVTSSGKEVVSEFSAGSWTFG